MTAGRSRPTFLNWLRMDTARSYYSQLNLELNDAGTFYFGEAWQLQ